MHSSGKRNTIILAILFGVLLLGVCIMIFFALQNGGRVSTEAVETSKTTQQPVAPGGSEAASVTAQSTTVTKSATVLYATKTNDEWQDWQSSGAAAQTEEDAQQPVAAIRAKVETEGITGAISYCAGDGAESWSDWVQGDAEAQTDGVGAVKFVITGDLASEYDVWYRARGVGMDWQDWASNGNPAGVQGAGAQLAALEVQLTKKGEAAPGNTQNPVAPASAVTTTQAVASKSGDEELDSIIDGIVANNTGTGEDALRNAYEYMSANYYYISMNEHVDGDWTEWSIPYAKEMYHNGQGNCYRFGSLFCWIARRLGYDAHIEVGAVPTRRGLEPHAWVEIVRDGKPYVCDPDMHKFKPGIELFMVPYEESQLEYFHSDLTPY